MKKLPLNWEKDWRENIFYESRSADQIAYIKQLLSHQREEIIRELRRWAKGKNITKDKLREKLNALAIIGGGK